MTDARHNPEYHSQTQVAERALAWVRTLPPAPTDGAFLSRDTAEEIVAGALVAIEDAGDDILVKYLTGPRKKRLIETLCAIHNPQAGNVASCRP